MRKLVVVMFILSMSQVFLGQTLFSVGETDVSIKEFKNMYEKNVQDRSELYTKESLETYLNLYMAYKLKLAEAKELGLYDNADIQQEIKRYQEDLIRSTFDGAIMDELLNEAYVRLKESVCVRHILIRVRSNAGASAVDAAYQNALTARNQIMRGNDFAATAKLHSDDIETKFDGGYIGCFTALQLSVYELESAAYNLSVGEVSMPVRTRLGYHILKLDDRKPASSEIEVAHVFTRANEFMEDSINAKARINIYKAYNALQGSEKFESVVSEFSEDNATKNNNGNLGWIGIGTYDSDFEDAIFKIKQVGDVTEPIKTSVGWHIFKLLDAKEIAPLAEMEIELRDKIKNDERYEKARAEYGETLKKKYGYEQDEEALTDFTKEVAPGISIDGWQTPSSFDYGRKLFSLGNNIYTASQLVNYVRSQHGIGRYLSFKRYYNNFEADKMMEYHKQELINGDDEMELLLNEYRDGIVLFNLMEQNIWKKEENLETEAKLHYERNRASYSTPNVVEVEVYECSDSRTAKKVRKLLSKNASSAAIKALNVKTPNSVELGTEYFTREEAKIGSKDLWRIGTMASKNSKGKNYFYKSIQMKPGVQKTYDEVSTEVIQDYRANIEKNWVENLKLKFPVQLNEAVLNSLVK